MTSRKVLAVMAALAILAVNAVAYAGVVDPANSYANMANPPAILTAAPGGDGDEIDYDWIVHNPTINHTVDVYVNDSSNNPVEILAVDLWLQDAYVVWCPGGVIADSSTYAPDPGHTTFAGLLRGGVAGSVHASCANDYLDVVALGQVIETLDMRINSPDLNGSGGVTLADFSLFATRYQTNNFCANYDEVGNVTLADFSVFASFYNLSFCP